MDICLRSLYLVAVLHVLAFGTILCIEMDVKKEEWKFCQNDLAIKNLINLRESFLVGENTPVWIAWNDVENGPVHYIKEEKFVVKAAIEYWKSDEIEGLLPANERRSVDERGNFVSYLVNFITDEFSTSSSKKKVRIDPTNNRETNEVYHPSILIMMDSDLSSSDFKKGYLHALYKKILYVLAFWNGVDLQLRDIRNPHIRLRIAGIIIRNDKEAVPYMRENVDENNRLKTKEAFASMMKYWTVTGKINEDFSSASYDIIVTMSNAKTPDDEEYSEYSSGLPCIGSDKNIAGLLLSDRQNFEGIGLAVDGLAQIFGAKNEEDCPLSSLHVMAKHSSTSGREWSPCNLKQISSTLIDDGSCLREAKEFHPPGTPVETILPGKLFPAKEQCRAYGFTAPYVCWDRTTCGKLSCANDIWYSECRKYPRMLDGSTCKTGMMCLDGKCVSNPPLIGYTGNKIHNFIKSAYIASCNKTQAKPEIPS